MDMMNVRNAAKLTGKLTDNIGTNGRTLNINDLHLIFLIIQI